MIWYPSLGNKNYPYVSDSVQTLKEKAWDLLERLAITYNIMSRGLRNAYSWSPSVIDDIEVHRLKNIFDEAVEDHKKNQEDEAY